MGRRKFRPANDRMRVRDDVIRSLELFFVEARYAWVEVTKF